MLSMPLEPMLATPIPALPAEGAPNFWAELKYDGYRGIVLVDDGSAVVQSRRGANLTRAFPEIAAAAASMLPSGTVVDGELLVWAGDGFNFTALQRRMASPATAQRLATTQPASMILFDLLCHLGEDIRGMALQERRALLETLEVAPPLQVTPYTRDVAEARAWVEDHRHARIGIEGVVVKDPRGRYEGGRRGWGKYRIRDTHEVVVGAITGTLRRPRELVVGYYDHRDQLAIAGATTPLDDHQALTVGQLLEEAVGTTHPWPNPIGAGTLGQWGGKPRAVTLVEPTLVVEVSADTALERGRWRHVTRFVRARPDLSPTEVSAPD